MENRISDKDIKFTSPKNSQRLQNPNNEFRSPKFLRRKQEIQTQFNLNPIKKREQKRDQSDLICYISPKKILQSQSFASLSSTSIASKTSFKPTENSYKKINPQEANYLNKLQELKNQSQDNTRQTVKKISINNKSLGEQNIQLKMMCMNLEEKLSRESGMIERLREENRYLVANLEGFNQKFRDKDEKIQELVCIVRMREEEIYRLKAALKDQRENVGNLQAIIQTINHKTFDFSFRELSETLSESTTDDNFQQQLKYYKDRVIQLTQLLKYSQIHQSIIPKLQSQLKFEKQKNINLNNSNNKLQAKIKSLLKQLDSKPKRDRIKQVFNSISRNRGDDEISLELSPEK